MHGTLSTTAFNLCPSIDVLSYRRCKSVQTPPLQVPSAVASGPLKDAGPSLLRRAASACSTPLAGRTRAAAPQALWAPHCPGVERDAAETGTETYVITNQ